MDYKKLGTKIKQERLKKSLTQEHLSEMCGISSSYIGIIERGDKKLSIETLIKIANVLEVGTDYLLADSLNAPSQESATELNSIISNLPPEGINLIIKISKTIAENYIK